MAPVQVAFLQRSLDWDEALRTCNRLWDELVLACQQPDRAARKKALAYLQNRCQTLGASADGFQWEHVLQRIQAGKHREAAQLAAAQIMLNSISFAERLRNAHDRCEQFSRLITLAFVITIYREEQGQLPERLEQLVPRYLAQIPTDVFSGKAPIYRRTDSGFVVYSVGFNERDDGGRGYEDSPPGERYDDIVVRVLASRPLR